jgi:hypothetical protein
MFLDTLQWLSYDGLIPIYKEYVKLYEFVFLLLVLFMSQSAFQGTGCRRGCMKLYTAQWVVDSGVELRPFALHLIISNNQAASHFICVHFIRYNNFHDAKCFTAPV